MSEEVVKVDFAKLESGLCNLVGFLIRNNKTDTDDAVLDRLTAALQKLKEKNEVTSDDFVTGMQQIVDWGTDVIPGDIDDMLIDSAVNTMLGIWKAKVKAWLDKYGK